jgi:hypothetical protein
MRRTLLPATDVSAVLTLLKAPQATFSLSISYKAKR